MFDAPCGDFHWMRYVLDESDLDYIGGDIVEKIIENNKAYYEKNHVKFVKFDISGSAGTFYFTYQITTYT